MAKISTYPLSTPVVGSDKWIGTDAQAATKNFSASAVSVFINEYNKIESQSLRYKYKDMEAGDVRLAGTITFDDLNTGTVPFSSLTQFKLSKQQINNAVDVSTYYTNPLLQSTVLISKCSDPSTFGLFEWDAAVQDGTETNFWNIDVTYATGYGSLEDSKDYFISLLTYKGDPATTYIHPQNVASATWTITHNLNSYPSVTVTDSANTPYAVGFGSVTYNSANQLTIVFSAAFAGKAFLN
ncbi:MAG: hypothetical protein GOVbin3530_25 [Prokaryotic dsDNA virus sp.]|jgi:hypothetical protein|nr:MAG: hypothetical protein GOVbin3530_25 [Prokaryotic dsDNA virus sp.]|tara:strand:+ start:2090 stop:2809 length:720 start_codon:yes stop_codon:yes gene_type:complete